MRALILSAGMGERLRPLTSSRAKPAIEFLNVPMLTYPYHWLTPLRLTDVIFNTYHLPDSIRHAAMHVVAPEVRLHFSHETEILGSGGGIWNARFDLMNDPVFAVANGDGVVLCPRAHLLCDMLEVHEQSGALATLLLCPLEGVGERIPGVWVHNDGRVAGFGKSSPAPGTQCLHYASYMLFSERIWPLLPEGSSNILYDVLTPQIQTGATVIGYRADDIRWFETGNERDFLAATKFCLEQIRDNTPLGMNALEVISTHGQSLHLQSQLDRMRLIADSAEIDPSAQLNGWVVLGDNCRIGAGAMLRDCVVLSEAKVDGGRQVQDTIYI